MRWPANILKMYRPVEQFFLIYSLSIFFSRPNLLSRTLQNDVKMAGFVTQHHVTHLAKIDRFVLLHWQQDHRSHLPSCYGNIIRSLATRAELFFEYKFLSNARQVQRALLCRSNGAQVLWVHSECTRGKPRAPFAIPGIRRKLPVSEEIGLTSLVISSSSFRGELSKRPLWEKSAAYFPTAVGNSPLSWQINTCNLQESSLFRYYL